MSNARTTALVLLTAAAIPACADQHDPTSITFDDLVGSWTAQSLVYASHDNSALAIDVIGTLDGDLELTIRSDRSFVGSIAVPGQTQGRVPIGGTVDLNMGIETIRVDFDPQTEAGGILEDFTADYDLSSGGDVLTWTYDDARFDFDGDGVEEDATVTVVLVAQ